MTRLVLVLACLASLRGAAGGQPPQATEGVSVLLTRLEQALRQGQADRYLDLLAPAADRRLAAEFARTAVTPGTTRALVREIDRVPLDGAPEGEGHRLLVDVFTEVGNTAWIGTWRLDVRRFGTGPSADWRIAGQEALTSLSGLYRLSLNPARQLAVRDLVVSAEDFRLVVPEGSMFLAETDSGPTAAVILGRGDMSFTPAPATERSQLRIVAGGDSLQSTFDGVFLRFHPSDMRARVAARETVEKPADPRDLRRAEEIFRQELGKSYGLDLADRSSDIWSLLPGPGDFLAEVRTRRFDSLAYARSADAIEDISVYDRKQRRNISVYSSKAHLAAYSPFYSDDDRGDYRVESYDIDVMIDPRRHTIDGRAELAIETSAMTLRTLTLQLGSRLAVQSVVSKEFGPLMCVRVRNQNALVVNLPATLLKGTRLTLTVTYAGPIEPQPIDREALALQLPQIQEVEDEDIPVEESFLYSNRSYWYPQRPTPGYATGRIRLRVPEPYSCVANGELVSVTPAPGPEQRGLRLRQFWFAVPRPVRYFACLIARLDDARTEKVTVRELGDARRASSARGVRANDITLTVKTTPRQKGRGREVARQAAAILRFYTSIVGDCPYPTIAVAAIERKLPGGHSPASLVVVSFPPPGSTLRWQDDPAAQPRFPEFFLAHELAHQWWGQAVGWKNYHEQWLSEGFSQYFAALYAERAHGGQVFDGIVARMQEWAVSKSDQGPVYLGYRIGHVKRDGRLFRAVIYNKGAMVLHMLRRLVGDEAFFRGLRRFYETWRFRTAGSDDFRQAMEAESGVRLDRFFERWVYGEGLPRVGLSWRLDERAGAPEAVVRLEQTGDVYDIPVTITLDYVDKAPQLVVVKLTERVLETRLPLAGRIRRIDVNGDSAALGHFTVK